MDVDIPAAEEAMETDPPQVQGKQPSIDPDGDEQMDAGEAVYDEEGDIEIAEGDESAKAGEEAEVDDDGDITPEEVGHEEEEYFYEDEDHAEEGVEIKPSAMAGEQVFEGVEEQVDDEEGNEEAESKETEGQVVEGTDITALTTSVQTADSASATQVNQETIEERQAEQGNVGVEEPASEAIVEVEEVAARAGTESVDVADEVVEPEPESETNNKEELLEVGDEQEIAPDHQQDGEEGVIHLEIEEEEEEEEYDHLTYDTLPPILLHLPNAQRALFNPILSEDGSTPPIWFAEKVQEFSEGTLSLLWAAIRVQLHEEGQGNDSDELVIVERLTDLKMGDSDVNLEDITFLELVQMYHDCALPEPMELHLEFHPHRFITRYNAIQQELGSREVIYIDEDEDEEDEDQAEEVEVEGEEEVMVGDDEEKHEYEVEVEEAAEEVSTEPAHTATGQLPVPLPTADSTANGDTEPAQDDSEHLVESADEVKAGVTEDSRASGTDNVTEIPFQQTEADGIALSSATEEVVSVPPPVAEAMGTPPSTDAAAPVDLSEPRDLASNASEDPSSAEQPHPEVAVPSTVLGAEQAETPKEQVSAPMQEVSEEQTLRTEESTEQTIEPTGSDEPPAEPADDETKADQNGDLHIGQVSDETAGEEAIEYTEGGGNGQGEAKHVDGEADADAEGEHNEAEGEEEEGEEAEEGDEEGEEAEEGDEEEEEYEYEGEETDPYGLDKLVDGISEEEVDQTGESAEEAVPEVNGSEEVLEEYEEESEVTVPGVEDATDVHGESAGETSPASPAKRLRSAEVEDADEAAGKRVKLGESELASETQ